MPSDFGDESGEKLFDWMLRLGQEAGQAAMAHSAARVSMAFRNAVGEIGHGQSAAAGIERASEATEWAKLNLHEFKGLPEFETIKEIIDANLDREALSHEFFSEGEKSYLIFRVGDAPEVARCFDELAQETTQAAKKAEQQLSREKGHASGARDLEVLKEPDKEPLQDRVEAFKKSAELVERAHGRSREVIDQARGR
ncbi:hypothetical protein [Gordonibacter pamelaeae]|jgi:hypothetical protein|uniref:Uncharacterized protein n=2 Tax=Gordonibacter pamelaeae TaxID=471189 RepID=D6EC04_9ACTN|nr:hypothetical protein [Gordonibacter pamelaeae]MCB6313224.1 hypothetical protein [Gordonibacter pamelaeae]MCQ4846647.1 hypothetical protein [Gordonibacter pamelaeae]MCQ4850341.1 hypothetical protein [Gordonibacter pamelaeae]RDB65249.1 hypothetical protein C1877_07860 [Gordonibacter pamelaeae]CBL05251.1 hypothetical protein GPA_35590 [Gordonibacter pamelaeae 7-10-1-b]